MLKATGKEILPFSNKNNKQPNSKTIKRLNRHLSEGDIDSQQAYKTVLNITTNWKMQI